MKATQITREHVKKYVVQHARVTNPYKKELWWASVTLGYDYAESGKTIEQAYNALTDKIFKSPTIMMTLSDLKSFRKIIGW